MELLNTAAGEAKETIGKGLFDALTAIGGDHSISDLATNMQNLATYTADVITGLGGIIGKLNSMPKIGGTNALLQIATLGQFGKIKKVTDYLAQRANRTASAQLAPASSNSFLSEHMAASNAAKQKAAEVAAKKRANDILKAQMANTKALKQQAALKKAGTVFDLEQIQLVAALKGKLSEDEKKRVEAQLALLNGNSAVATKLTNEILASQDATGQLAKLLTSLPNANNPFQYLDGYLDSLKKKAESLIPATGASVMDNYLAGAGAGNTQVLPQTNATDYSGFALDLGGAGSAGSAAQFGSSTPWSQAAANFVLQIDGKDVAYAVQGQALNGNGSTINRALGSFS
jgi:hypothetical protein